MKLANVAVLAAVLCAEALAQERFCDDLAGINPAGQFAFPVSNTAEGCGASWCPGYPEDPTVHDRLYARKDKCEEVGMRLCTIQELENNWAAGTGCNFDHNEVWSSTECLTNARYTWQSSTGTKICRSTEWATAGTQTIRCCARYRPTAHPTTAHPTTAEPTAQPTTAEPTTAQPTTAEPTTAQPTTAEPTVDAAGFSGGVDGLGWEVAKVGDTIYKCNPQYCLENTLVNRHTWVRVDRPAAAPFLDADGFSATTSDGTWTSDGVTLSHRSQSFIHTFSYHCQCSV